MKKYLLILIMTIALLLTACMPAMTNPTDSVPTSTTLLPTTTAPIPTTTDSVPTTTEPVTTATNPPSTDPVPTTIPPNPAEFAEFYGLFQYVAGERNPYQAALDHEYSSPAELKLRYFFDNGFPGENEASDLEWAELKDISGFNINYDFYRLPKDKMEAELQKYFGISLTDIPDSGFEGLTYLKSTDCYYFMATAPMTNAVNFAVQSVEYNSDGTISLTYTVGWEPLAKKYVIELKPNDDDYLVLSNLKIE